MSNQEILLAIAIAGLVIVNVAAFRYMGFWGFLVTASCYPLAEKILNKLLGLT